MNRVYLALSLTTFGLELLTTGSHTIILAFSRVSIVIISAYSGNLITYLVVLDERPPVSGLFDPKVIQIDLYPHTAVLEFHFLFPSQILFQIIIILLRRTHFRKQA